MYHSKRFTRTLQQITVIKFALAAHTPTHTHTRSVSVQTLSHIVQDNVCVHVGAYVAYVCCCITKQYCGCATRTNMRSLVWARGRGCAFFCTQALSTAHTDFIIHFVVEHTFTHTHTRANDVMFAHTLYEHISLGLVRTQQSTAEHRHTQSNTATR